VDPVIKNIYKQIAEETGLDIKQIQEIVKSQFQFVRDIMASASKNDPDSFKTINITHLGKFAIREYKVEEYYKKSLKNDSRGEGTK
jgi:nucleoid DNA-binding protein